MQSTGQGSRHLSQPEHSSGRMMTSMPWLKMAPKFGGQARRQASQLMHCDISMNIGGLSHFVLRSRLSIRDRRAGVFPDAIYRILRGDFRSESITGCKAQDTFRAASTHFSRIPFSKDRNVVEETLWSLVPNRFDRRPADEVNSTNRSNTGIILTTV